MKSQFECLYCGHKWIEFNLGYNKVKTCTKPGCGDRHIRERPLDVAKIDAYCGAPDFIKDLSNDKDEWQNWPD